MSDLVTTKQHTYSIDLKIYEPANIGELPFALPLKIMHSSILILGYHTVVMAFTEEEFTQFCEQVGQHGLTLKIIGTERLD